MGAANEEAPESHMAPPADVSMSEQAEAVLPEPTALPDALTSEPAANGVDVIAEGDGVVTEGGEGEKKGAALGERCCSSPPCSDKGLWLWCPLFP